MRSFIKKNWILIVIILIASFLYIYRLRDTFVMAGDTARDLIRVMEIWQNKEITMIGPPVNTISNNPVHFFFGSFYYYFAIPGLIVSGFDPIGSVFINVLLTLISIPFFFFLSKKLLKDEKLSFAATAIYAFSPITVSLTRSYWNPNLIIPLSVFMWFCFLYKKSRLSFVLGGIFAGIILNLHYSNFIALIPYLIYLMLSKNKKTVLFILSGFLVAMLPFAAFEIKNNFFLMKAFLGTIGGFSTFAERTLNSFLGMDVFLYIFGLGPSQYFISSLFDIAFIYRIIFDTLIGVGFLFFLIKKQKTISPILICVIITGILVGWFFEKAHILALRYVLSVYPLFIISVVAFISSVNKYLLLLPVIPMLILSVKIVTHKLDPNIREDYLPLSQVEDISKAIAQDNPTGKYNVTENILGDARSLASRYYLMRDALVKPQPVEVYDRIDTLYVISHSLDRIYKEDRWEFSASGPKKIAWKKFFGNFILFKFVK